MSAPDKQMIKRVAANVRKQINEDQAAMIAERKAQYGDRFQVLQKAAIEELHRHYKIGVDKMVAALSAIAPPNGDEVREALEQIRDLSGDNYDSDRAWALAMQLRARNALHGWLGGTAALAKEKRG